MIQNNYKDSVKEISGDVQTTGFNIEVNESMFQMLTSNVYNDPILAVMREWSTNACDACIAGDLDVKYDVHLPTEQDKTFSVRDYGIGLSPDDIVGMFSNLGASTKRDSDKYNGTLGIGRMSGLAVSNSFSVDSYYNGKLHSYVISVKKGVPVTLYIGENDTTEPNGLKLAVHVETTDFDSYHSRAEKLYKYFDHKPILNIGSICIDLDISDHISDRWFIQKVGYPDHNKNFVVMSQVAYEIPFNNSIDTKGFSNLVIKVPPGSVTFNPGRESLSLNKSTIEYINNLFEEIKEEYLERVNVALALSDNDKELVKIYNKSKNDAPYQIKDDITIEPFVSNEYKYLSYNPYTKNTYDYVAPSIDFDTATNYMLTLSYKAGRNTISKKVTEESNLHSHDFFSANHVIVDMKTNFRQELNNSYPNEGLVTWQKSSDTDIEDAVAEAKRYIEALGLTYKLASEVVNVSKTKAITRNREGLYASRYNKYNGKFLRSEKVAVATSELPTVYVNLSSTEPMVGDYSFNDVFSIYTMLTKIFPHVIENEEGEEETIDLVFCGIPKKYRKQVESLDNWVDVMTYIETMAKDETFVRPLNVELPRFNSSVINYDNLSLYPIDIQNYYKEIYSYREFNSVDRFVKSDYRATILEDAGANFESYIPTLDVDIGKLEEVYEQTLPMITDAYGTNGTAIAIRLATLEEFYEIHRN